MLDTIDKYSKLIDDNIIEAPREPGKQGMSRVEKDFYYSFILKCLGKKRFEVQPYEEHMEFYYKLAKAKYYCHHHNDCKPIGRIKTLLDPINLNDTTVAIMKKKMSDIDMHSFILKVGALSSAIIQTSVYAISLYLGNKNKNIAVIRKSLSNTIIGSILSVASYMLLFKSKIFDVPLNMLTSIYISNGESKEHMQQRIKEYHDMNIALKIVNADLDQYNKKLPSSAPLQQFKVI